MKIVFATNNKNKVKEIKALLPKDIEILSLKDIGCTEDIEETENTIEGNARLKADYITKNYGYDCFADDTGLEVDALGGKPGVFSARYAGEDGNAGRNIEKLLSELQGQENRSARFRTVISLIIKGKAVHFEGIVEGAIIHERRGADGFGYDPVFLPDGYDKTFAEMDLGLKNSISHRGRAMRKLIEHLREMQM